MEISGLGETQVVSGWLTVAGCQAGVVGGGGRGGSFVLKEVGWHRVRKELVVVNELRK